MVQSQLVIYIFATLIFIFLAVLLIYLGYRIKNVPGKVLLYVLGAILILLVILGTIKMVLLQIRSENQINQKHQQYIIQ